MSDTNIAVSDEVWMELNSRKQPGDTFDEVLRRELGLESGDANLRSVSVDSVELPSDESPYKEQVETAVAIVRQSQERVPKSTILEAVPEAKIQDESLWQKHIRPTLDERGDVVRNKGWQIDK